jgi:hypothetical protein
MPDSCLEGTEIEIQCKNFYNPIYQDQWDGYYIEAYDNEDL